MLRLADVEGGGTAADQSVNVWLTKAIVFSPSKFVVFFMLLLCTCIFEDVWHGQITKNFTKKLC